VIDTSPEGGFYVGSTNITLAYHARTHPLGPLRLVRLYSPPPSTPKKLKPWIMHCTPIPPSGTWSDIKYQGRSIDCCDEVNLDIPLMTLNLIANILLVT
jgi:hypothetical protein